MVPPCSITLLFCSAHRRAQSVDRMSLRKAALLEGEKNWSMSLSSTIWLWMYIGYMDIYNTVKAFSHIIVFWGQHNSYAGKSMRPLHIMVTSTMSNRLGEGCILMVLKHSKTREFKDLCCKSYALNRVNVQGEGFWLDFVATECYRPGEHTILAYKMKRKTSRNLTPGSGGICRDAVECTGIC